MSFEGQQNLAFLATIQFSDKIQRSQQNDNNICSNCESNYGLRNRLQNLQL